MLFDTFYLRKKFYPCYMLILFYIFKKRSYMKFFFITLRSHIVQHMMSYEYCNIFCDDNLALCSMYYTVPLWCS